MGIIWIDKKQLVIDIWARLRDGASPESLVSEDGPSLRTIERFRQVAEAIENGQLAGDIAKIGGWDVKRGRDFLAFYEEFREKISSEEEDGQTDHLRYQNLPVDLLWDIVSPIINSMWMPEPDKVPVDFSEVDPGFRIADVGSRQFCWT